MFSLVNKMLVETFVTHVSVLGFDLQLWLQTPATRSCRLSEAEVMVQVIGFLLSTWENWIVFPILDFGRGHSKHLGTSVYLSKNKKKTKKLKIFKTFMNKIIKKIIDF